eukprot:PhM_4_TR1272/c0_g1_i1/m.87271
MDRETDPLLVAPTIECSDNTNYQSVVVDDEAPRHTQWRYIMAALLSSAMAICYADRTNIGVAVLYFDMSDTKQGLVLSAFYYGYICTQLAGGLLSARLGGKCVLLACVVIWTIFDLSTVVTERMDFVLLLASRVGMGLGEGATMPVFHDLSSLWYPKEEISSLMQIQVAGQDVGTVLALLLAPQLADHFGWRTIFYVWSVIAAAWACLFIAFGASEPERHRLISIAETETSPRSPTCSSRHTFSRSV